MEVDVLDFNNCKFHISSNHTKHFDGTLPHTCGER